GLRPGAEPDRTGVGQRQDARTGQCVRVGADRAAPALAQRLRPRAPPVRPRLCVPSAYRTPTLICPSLYLTRLISAFIPERSFNEHEVGRIGDRDDLTGRCHADEQFAAG